MGPNLKLSAEQRISFKELYKGGGGRLTTQTKVLFTTDINS